MLASNCLRACGESVNPGQHLVGLNDAQRAAAEHGRGPLLVIAGAGSGKTNTLAHRVANLVVHGADPRRILLLTFSRRAASEMARPPNANVAPGNPLGTISALVSAAFETF
jgi:ATP-dependent DNA helicase UvrD/PcrA